jgi:hypothetical protein
VDLREAGPWKGIAEEAGHGPDAELQALRRDLPPEITLGLLWMIWQSKTGSTMDFPINGDAAGGRMLWMENG